ncbi:ABC transporter permease [Chloroflexus sp. Y-396-1]|uniref:ABC transporter permease n=1 Tax=Chloroflexus sp. Y-396-1 TaxID=867845 RepID=UPI00049072E6|nr:ABC transporter permease [Chloroflexus sp. Y-396-1]
MQQTLPMPTVSPRARALRRFEWHALGLPVTLVSLLLLWQAGVTFSGYPAFILPSPALVAGRFWQALSSGILWQHTSATLSAALGGFALALIIAVVLGYTLAHIRWLEQALAPVLAASQAIPVVAVAPLIILWFGTGLTSKVLVAALITFLPILIGTIVAIRSIPRELIEMAYISGANRWQLLRYVEVPLALPVLFGGIRTGLSLATTGAVVGEFVAGRVGLGALINIARGLFDTPLIFVALITLALITLTLYVLAGLLERILVRWEA